MFISCVANQPFVVNHSGCVLGSPFERKKYLVESPRLELGLRASHGHYLITMRRPQYSPVVRTPEQILLEGVQRRLQITYD